MNEKGMSPSDDFDPQEVEKPDIQYVEIDYKLKTINPNLVSTDASAFQ